MENNPTQPSPAPVKRQKLPLGGVILIIVGVFWLLNNIGLNWADKVWVPAVVIVAGLYVITKRKD